ncbi:PREDICTED: cyclic nucleotide-gated ion channel 1-like [Fragaria vesca subsp. vesca]|uniref:cyclic nucleotide-gated ion channel 1-like n=1 Tax=Fragaria vesca subsp. vesca TaxID=101020 RepID=UPI0002C31B5C|nr:PREDICTED: cyclic nucleotide-gated ion channel 1-like [Fragaria vesca subsp. vesca]
MSSRPDIDDAVEHANVSTGIVNATKKKCERMLLSVSFWNKISVIACMTAVSIDPLFFYIAFIDRNNMCLGADKRLRTVVLVTRSLTDFTFLFHIVYNLCDAAKAVASESKRRTVQKDNSKVLFNWFGRAKAIAKKLSWSSFLSDILAILPIPHVLILALFYAPNYGFSENKMTLNYLLLAQYAPRMYRIFTSSEVVGAFWYFSTVQIQAVCWHMTLGGQVSFQCDDPPLSQSYHEIIDTICHNSTGDDSFPYGSFLETITAGYTGRTRFRDKLFYFVWWGLKNLSNFGTNIATSDFIWENCFAILVSGMGLVLFAFLIGNMQLCMQSSEEKNVATDKVQMKEQELQEWMDKNGLPEKLGKDAEKLRIQIMKKITKNLKEDQNAELHNLFTLIPWNAVKDLKPSVCMSMLKKVPRLEIMDERGLRLICHYLKPVTYSSKTIAFRMGEPLDSMLFIMEGIMLIYPTSAATATTTTTTAHQVERANIPFRSTISGSLENGDAYGVEQLLSWASPPDMSDVSYADLPILTENVKCLSEVDGFVLTAKDLKSVFSLYKIQGNYNSSSHLVEVERSTSRGTSSNRRCRINPTPRPGTEGGDEETDIQ